MAPRKNQILSTALEIADEFGLDAVTMRAVANRVGITPMALYRHVEDKEALLDGMLELAMSEVPAPPADLGWEARLTELAGGVRDMARRHPAAIGLAFSRPGYTPGVRRLVGAIHEAFAEAGVPERHRARLERMVSTFVVGFAVSEVSGRFPHDQAEGLAREFARDLRDLMDVVRAVATED
ncbi:TetR/AcrR family transcriptional regulator [Isoptericola sp. b490]|uniref:TetR/AcrR family transcriptional regulator n=1 Tax=Actinotalea lenta TaxID=3064654 RepID=UPI002712ECBC|nr:TetR/AcrR family transcriptional regulator [Isoptericola sp. b490]MDO8122239.1 TetR/AcrR family transcriptional regulator [Isoptericola sp. b490]